MLDNFTQFPRELDVSVCGDRRAVLTIVLQNYVRVILEIVVHDQGKRPPDRNLN